ncbi:LamG-like jellyroll fold domain-containing protein, partial [Nanoarchaeota archaeon]
TIINFYYGIYWYNDANHGTLLDNTVNNNTNVGIMGSSASNNSLTSNTMRYNSNHGIYLTSAHNNTLTSNIANYNGDVGIYLVSSSTNQLTSNLADNNTYGVYVDSSSHNNTIEWNNASRNLRGVSLYSNNNTVTSNIANNNTQYGIYLSSSNSNTLTSNNASHNGDMGIYLLSSEYNVITSNTADYNYQRGIYLASNSNNNAITSNSARGNTDHGFYVSGSYNILTNNTAYDQTRGFQLSSARYNTLINNTANCGYGIDLTFSHNNSIISNTLYDNSVYGIYVWFSENNSLTSNILNNSQYGVYLEDASNNLIYNNYFDSTNNAYDDGNNSWNISKTAGTNIIGGPYLGGNYFSDYTGLDLDGDGLGDSLTPYGTGMTYPGDWHPLTTPRNNTVPTSLNPHIGGHNKEEGDSRVLEMRFEYGNSTWTYDETESNNGTVLGATHTDEGYVGKGYEFDGVESNISIGNQVVTSEDFTVSLWVKSSGTQKNTYNVILSQGHTTAGNEGGWAFQENYPTSNEVDFIFGNGYAWYGVGFDYNPNTDLGWHHLVVTIENGTTADVISYKDGVQIDSDNTHPIVLGNRPLTIGEDSANADREWFGSIDEVVIWNRSLTAAEISDLYNSSKGEYAYDENSIGCGASEFFDNESLNVSAIYNWYLDDESITVLNMPFESHTGNESAETLDYSGYKNNGTVSGATWSRTSGHDGKGAYEFVAGNNHASGDYIDTGSDSSLEIINEITLAAWIKGDSMDAASYGAGRVLYFADSGASNGYGLGTDQAHVSCHFDVDSNYNFQGSTSLQKDKWEFIACTYDGSNIIAYLNGEEDGIQAATGTIEIDTTETLQIGRKNVGSSYFNGTIDEVFIFNRSLSAGEITKLYQNGLSSLSKNETSKHERWSCSIMPHDTFGAGTELFSNDLVLNQEPDHEKPLVGAHNDITYGRVLELRFEYGNTTTADDPFGWTYDESEYGNNGTVVNATKTYAGRVGQGYEFDADGDYIEVPHDSSLNMYQYTMSVWFKPSSLNDYQRLLDQGFHGCELPAIWIRDSGVVWFSMDNCTSETRISVNLGTASEDNWHHAAITYNGNDFQGYIDGVPGTPVTGKGASYKMTQSSSIKIGTNYNKLYNFFNGTIDEVTIFNRSLSLAEIQDIYNSSRNSRLIESTKDIGCSLNNSNDDDIDSIKALYNWYVNNESITLLNMPFESINSKHHDINNSDMVAAWYMEGDGLDRTAHGNDGTIAGGVTLVDGKVGQGYEFDGGSGSYVSISDDDSLDIADELSISLWLYSESERNGYASYPIQKYGSSTTSNYRLYYFGDTSGINREVGFYATRGGGWGQISGRYLTELNRWYHIGLSYDSSSGGQLYINGKPEGSLTGSGSLYTNDIDVSIGQYFHGSIDEVIIINRTLSADEIEALYKEGLDSEEDTKDYSGYENYGEVINASYDETAGHDGFGAYEFDGKTSKIKIANFS